MRKILFFVGGITLFFCSFFANASGVIDSFKFNQVDTRGFNFIYTPNQIFDILSWSNDLQVSLVDYRKDTFEKGKVIAGADGYGEIFYYKNYLKIGDYKVKLVEPLTKVLSTDKRIINPMEQLFWNNGEQFEGYLAESKNYVYSIQEDFLLGNDSTSDRLSRVIVKKQKKAKDFKRLNSPILSFKVDDKSWQVRELSGLVLDNSYEGIVEAEVGGESIYRKGDFLYLTRTSIFPNRPILELPIDGESFLVSRRGDVFTMEDKNYIYVIISHGRYQYMQVQRIKKETY